MACEDSWAVGRIHDAEVTSLRLERSGPSLELAVTADPGSSTQQSMLLMFREVTDMDFVGFNTQHALFDITAERTPEGHRRVRLSAGYALRGCFQCSGLPALPLPQNVGRVSRSGTSGLTPVAPWVTSQTH